MRLLVTADLHYNHPRSRPLADELIDEMTSIPADVLLLIGDTAVADGPELEQCLARFRFPGPKLFVAGNHELWTKGDNSHHLFTTDLPRRIQQLGWHWLQTQPFIREDLAIVGSIGWYDYSFAQPELGIPTRFYEHKLSPGAVRYLDPASPLLKETDDIPPQAQDLHARWNDGQFVKLHRSDTQFLKELLSQLQDQLDSLRHYAKIVAAIHHLPFAQLLPPSRNAQWDFAKAYLGSGRLGELLLRYPNLSTLLCGHSHFPAEAKVGHIHALNIGSGYRHKTYKLLDL